MVEKHIKELLHEHDCVIIPDFGGLITRYVPARIHPVKHTLAPPSKRLAFNEKLKLNDGLLINTIAERQQISKADAKIQVAEFVRNVRADINKNNRYEIKGVGLFNYTPERKLEFEYADQENFLSDSFGLPELVLRPIQHTDKSVLRTAKKPKPEPVAPKEDRRFRRFMRKYSGFAASLLIGGLTMSAVYLFSLQTEYNLSSLTPITLNDNAAYADRSASGSVARNLLSEEEQAAVFASILPKQAENTSEDEDMPGPFNPMLEAGSNVEVLDDNTAANSLDINEVVSKDTVIAVIKNTKSAEKEALKNTISEAKPAVKKSEKKSAKLADKGTMNEVPGRYYIISDAFNNLENAEVRLNQILNQGDNGKIIMPGSGSSLHRVSIADFASKEEADKKLQELRKKYGQSIWVLNY